VSELAEWLAARSVTRAQLEAAGATAEPDVAYERLRGVERIHAPELHPAFFYFTGDELRMAFIPDEHTEGRSAAPLAAELGPPDRTLRSRAGKNSRIELHGGDGIAYSHDGDRLEFIEVFAPGGGEWYLDEVYEDPGAFCK
jgi:hypothetical protein